MNNTAAEFSELLALAQLYLLQENPKGGWLSTDSETFTFFKNLAITEKVTGSADKAAIPSQPIENISTKTTAVVRPSLDPREEQQKKPVQKRMQNLSLEQPTTKTPIPPQESKNEREPSSLSREVLLEPIAKSAATDFADIKMHMSTLFPHHPIQDAIPSDVKATSLASAWKQKNMPMHVVILMRNEIKDEHNMLTRLCEAMQERLLPTKIFHADSIETADEWLKIVQDPTITLIIMPPSYLDSCKKLRAHYTERNGMHYIGPVRLLFTEEYCLYIQEPKHRKTLWQTICAMVGKQPNSGV